MSIQEVTNVLFRGFSNFDLDKMGIQYFKCGQDNQLSLNEEQKLDGDGIFELTGQGSLYLSQEQSVNEVWAAIIHI